MEELTRQEEEDDIRKAVQERYMEKYQKEIEEGSRPRYYLFTLPGTPGYSMVLPNRDPFNEKSLISK